MSFHTPEVLWARVGDNLIWEIRYEKLLGLTIDKNLKFDKHLSLLCKKASGKVSALARMVKILPFDKKRSILKTFVESQFSYCPLIWMFCSRKMNRKMNHIHERALRLVYDDYISPFEELLVRDKAVSIHHRNIQKVAIEMYKVKNNLCPEFIRNIFCDISRQTRSEVSFLKPKVNTVYKGELSLRCFGPIVWNTMVPEKLKEISDLADFKKKISTWVPGNCICRLCKDYVQNVGFVTVI